jgi:hypothetical protein
MDLPWPASLSRGFVPGVPALAFDAGAAAQPVSLPVATPLAKRSALANADISSVVGAPVHITLASLVHRAKPEPYCEVLSYGEPSVRFEVRLPSAPWTQRFVQAGCRSRHTMEARFGSVAQLRDLRTRHDRPAPRQGIQNGVSIKGVEI